MEEARSVDDSLETCHEAEARTGQEVAGESPAGKRSVEETTSVDDSRRARLRLQRLAIQDCYLTAACRELERQSPARNASLEKDTSVDASQKARFQRIEGAIRAQGKLFAAQGAIVASWKTYHGKRLGPYYRIAYRIDGRQKSLYLGVSEWLVAKVRDLLTTLQSGYREHRTLERLQRHARRALAASKKHLAHLLRTSLGALTKGWEFRGAARALCQLGRQYDEEAYAQRSAAAHRLIRGAPPET